MDKITDDMLFIAADGDGVGKKVGRAVIANDVEELHKISSRIDAAQDFILHWAKQNDGVKVSGGGDEFTAAIPKEAEIHIESLRKDIEHAFGYTISVGVGKSLAEAGTALLVAKLRGKDQVVRFNDDLKKEIQKAKRRVREKRATPDEYKLAEAYLEKAENSNNYRSTEAQPGELAPDNCQYCEESEGTDPDHCKYCHDQDAKEGEEECPYCKEQDGAVSASEDDCPYCKDVDANSEEECPYCKEGAQEASEQNPKIQSPDSNDAQAPAGSQEEKEQYNQMGMNPPILGKPGPGNNTSPAGMATASGSPSAMYDTAGAPVEPPSAGPEESQSNETVIPEEGAHSKESLQAIAQEIQKQTIEGKPEEKAAAAQIDDTDLTGEGSEGNVSRPEGFESGVPGDTGLDGTHAAEDKEPDLSAVLKEGLDNKSDEIQKDKVVQMVSQSLQQFKAAKMALENSKLQDPTIYNASIMVLKAMIELCKLAGLDSSGPEGSEGPIGPHGEQVVSELQGQPEQDEWADPFPKHPDHGGERKPGHAAPAEGAAPAPKDRAPIGQPIGKLPKKATKHVARTPLPPGAINAKGQQKVIDPKTGDTRFIDRKKGMVQSQTGVPIKPPSRGKDEQPKN